MWTRQQGPIDVTHHRKTASRPLTGIVAVALLLATGPAVGAADASTAHRSSPRMREAIVGGSTAPAGSFPWMAFVAYQGATSFACSGTVVSPNVVLTAGHCVVDDTTGVAYPASGYSVITGTGDWSDATPGQQSGVSSTALYPGFNAATLDGDAGLLVLSTPTSAPSVALATAADSSLYQAGTAAAIAGWGETQAGAGQLPTALQWGSTVVQSTVYCQQYAGLFDAEKVCATDAPSFSDSTCFGDSGGPLVADDGSGEPVEIGITSTGASDCSTSTPDVFTRTDLISTWAASMIAAVAPPPDSPPADPPSPPAAPSSQHPRATLEDATSDARQTLQGVFGHAFASGQRYAAHCARSAPSRFRCSVAWSHHRTAYRGSVTIIYTLAGRERTWTAIYRVRVSGTGCYSDTSGRRSCAGRVIAGSR